VEPPAGCLVTALNAAVGAWRFPAMASAGLLPLEAGTVAACVDPRERPGRCRTRRGFRAWPRCPGARSEAGARLRVSSVTWPSPSPSRCSSTRVGQPSGISSDLVLPVLISCSWGPTRSARSSGGQGHSAPQSMAADATRRTCTDGCNVPGQDRQPGHGGVIASGDVFGALVLVNLHDLVFKIALTRDFRLWRLIETVDEPNDVAWLDSAGESGE
jgi:hypothetical protein